MQSKQAAKCWVKPTLPIPSLVLSEETSASKLEGMVQKVN